MALPTGTRLGPYEIATLIGSGGMGEVYRARDTKLGRDVALKVLPESFAVDEDRLARFQREAEVLATLNHPHIAAIYGLEDSNGTRALVLELVEGPTLADRLAQGRIPVGEALNIARQIAEAIQAAHERGILHRDLKPANIKVTADGAVKVLDFGLAKSMAPALIGSGSDRSPAITTHAAMTEAGIVLGTAAYMSPEQAKGREADRRSDIWGFGCVLYEMLTGRRAFDGEDMTEILGAVVRLEPDWAAVPSTLAPAVHTLLQACLAKDRRQRVADMSTVLFVLENATYLTTGHTEAEHARVDSARGGRPVWRDLATVGTVALVIGAGASAWHFRGSPAAATTDPQPVRLSLLPPPGVTLAPGVNQIVPVVSPDGRRLAFSASRPGEAVRLWVRSLDTLDAQPVPGTDNARGPFWSPDGRTLAFFADEKLKAIDVAGGLVRTVCEVSNDSGTPGASWSRAGTIVFARRSGGLMRVAAAGGEPSPATAAELQGGDMSQLFPSFLPDGHRFLYLSRPSNTLWLGTLDSREATRLFTAGSQVLYADGYLLFARQGTLLAQPFDASSATLTGDPIAIAEEVAVDSTLGAPIAAFSSSENGVLVYRTDGASAQTQLTWIDRSGSEIGKVGPVGSFRNPVLSGDGTRVALEASDANTRTQDLYILELARGTLSRFTFDRGNDIYPVWSPDDRRIAFGSDRQGGTFSLYEKMSSGAGGEQILYTAVGEYLTGPAPWDWSPDGNFLLFRNTSQETHGAANVGILLLSGERASRLLFPPASFNQTQAQISPDGRWVAYYSRETARNEVYIAGFPTPGGKWPISAAGGSHPRWRGDGKELYYYATDGRIMAVPISATTTPDPGTPVPLFSARMLGGPVTVTGLRPQYDVTADGRRFLLNVPVDGDASSPGITVVLNWAAALRRGESPN
jgi:Tol biopolymer transport system component